MMLRLPDKEPGCLSVIKNSGKFSLLSLANTWGIFGNPLPSPVAIVPCSRGMQELGREHRACGAGPEHGAGGTVVVPVLCAQGSPGLREMPVAIGAMERGLVAQ